MTVSDPFGFLSVDPTRLDNEYTTGTGQELLNVHHETDECHKFGCVVHAPSDHNMSDFPTHWRDDRGIMERICTHGIGHPDPDDMNYIRRTRGDDAAWGEGVHGCDGCCTDPPTKEDTDDSTG